MNHQHYIPRKCSHRGAPSSFWMQESEQLFCAMDLQKGDHFLDLGCGAGDYLIEAAKHLGPSGKAYGVDISEKTIELVKKKLTLLEGMNIEVQVCNMLDALPFKDDQMNSCLIATVLHCVDLPKYGKPLFQEIQRVLKPSGRLFIVECNKDNLSFGPPAEMRVDPNELIARLESFGYRVVTHTNLGFNYMLTLQNKA